MHSISRQNFNEYIGTLHLARTQFHHILGSYRTTGLLRKEKRRVVHILIAKGGSSGQYVENSGLSCTFFKTNELCFKCLKRERQKREKDSNLR